MKREGCVTFAASAHEAPSGRRLYFCEHNGANTPQLAALQFVGARAIHGLKKAELSFVRVRTTNRVDDFLMIDDRVWEVSRFPLTPEAEAQFQAEHPGAEAKFVAFARPVWD